MSFVIFKTSDERLLEIEISVAEKYKFHSYFN